MTEIEPVRSGHRRGLKTAAWLLFGGMLVEVVSLNWANAPAFLAFIGAGGSLVVAGVLRYALAIFPRTAAVSSDDSSAAD